MAYQDFSIIVTDKRTLDQEFIDKLINQGCHDCTPTFMYGLVLLLFSRQAADRHYAILSAIDDLWRMGVNINHLIVF